VADDADLIAVAFVRGGKRASLDGMGSQELEVVRAHRRRIHAAVARAVFDERSGRAEAVPATSRGALESDDPVLQRLFDRVRVQPPQVVAVVPDRIQVVGLNGVDARVEHRVEHAVHHRVQRDRDGQ